MKKVGTIMVGLILLFIVLFGYTIWDNNRIKVVEQEIVIEDLSDQLEGFLILQVSDLHEKEFGNNQKKLIEKINRIDYDAIAFTGDMLDGIQNTNYQRFHSLLEGIANKENAWFVPGNTDPESYVVTTNVEKSEFINGMEEQGVKLLETIDTITVGDSVLDFVNFEMAIKDGYVGINEGTPRPSYANNKLFLKNQESLLEEMKVLDDKTANDVLIALGHYPVVDARIDQIKVDSRLQMRDFDLIMAGHYHGGQIRLPFIGAFFVPEAWYQNQFFPPRNRVKGLWEYKGSKQYVSTGLGSSDAVAFLNFRFLNPPEINLLKLTKGE
ncbi:metallophosphoesterase [Aquibacillus saliphilus]|uniref:metallophosphoesterase n=1 Tax=Aquibacillus saliphilus TaxID=1909422 RepID=UPI001CF06C76|nr:metallophosphoesterase [Aquibacillus saliphilus]